jgi:uncharacterized protein YraI
MRTLAWLATALLLSAAPLSARAQDAYVTVNLNMRAAPDIDYPLITTIPAGTRVSVQGCVDDWLWCDVIAYGERGWVSGDYLEYDYGNRRVLLPSYGAYIGIPIVSFVIGDYWGRHYSHRSFYRHRHDWYSRPVHYRSRSGHHDRWDDHRYSHHDRGDSRRDNRHDRREVRYERRDDRRDNRRDRHDDRRDVRQVRRDTRQDLRQANRSNYRNDRGNSRNSYGNSAPRSIARSAQPGQNSRARVSQNRAAQAAPRRDGNRQTAQAAPRRDGNRQAAPSRSGNDGNRRSHDSNDRASHGRGDGRRH